MTGQEAGLGIGQRAHLPPRSGGDGGIDRTGLGPIAKRGGERTPLGRIDHHDCRAGGMQLLHLPRLQPARCLER